MYGTSTPAQTGQDVDELRAFIARSKDKTSEQVREDLGVEFAQQRELADWVWARACEEWGRLPTEAENREIWAASAGPASQLVDEMSEERRHALASSPEGAQIMESVRAFFPACHERPRSVMGPRRTRVRVRTRERRSGRSARRTSSPKAGGDSDPPGSSDGDGEPPPPLGRASQDRRPA